MSEPVAPAAVGAANSDKPVTVVVRRAVKKGREKDYEAWLERLTSEVSDQLPGYLGAEMQRPPAGSSTFTSVFRFDSVENLTRFEESDLRRQKLAEATDLFLEDAIWQRHTGLEIWFDPPAGAVIPQPSRLRMALLLTVVVYVLVLVIGGLAAAALGDAVPGPIRLLLVITVEVFLMTYLILPRLTRLLRNWIYPSSTVT